MTPKRIQRKRTKGWRMPENAVYVGRPTKWGNPFEVNSKPCSCRSVGECDHIFMTTQEAVEMYEKQFSDLKKNGRLFVALGELRGKDLACWCPLDQPCHADVLLEQANKEKE